ncbi:hypothetical protein [Polaribacter sp. HaHaR_3_91]|uniref:hypothetical protein n=1 Tax=Polaribacter sp. HaHaR_3_91 TaxID=2745561 RepID=UPI001C4F4E50|nr:hypothetical protein [Polaribacter sp. HaHaR_3_91]QXP64362.1 hypothetical protein H0I27_04020 [Polaribacter sp. HaHaR_3_91]
MKTNNQKVNEQPKCIVLNNYIIQTVDFILKEDNIDYKNTLITILKVIKYEEFDEIITTIKYSDKTKYKELIKASENLSIYNDTLKNYRYGFKTRIEDDFLKLHNDSKDSLSTGDLVAFLLNQHSYYKKINSEIIVPAINLILDEIIISLKQNIPLLKQEINHQSYLPISKAIYVFLISPKKEAINKFKNIIRKDLDYKNNSDFQYEYFVTVDRFFNRLDLDYIPYIENIPEKHDFKLGKKSNSITKPDISAIIDKDDFFNINIPLINYDTTKLINPNTDFDNMVDFTKILSALFEYFYSKNYNQKLKFDLGKVFIENITQPYSKYPDDILIRTREILKKMFANDSEFKKLFFTFLYVEKEADRINGWVNKFPKLLNHYLGGLENLKEGTIKRYFFNTEKNPVIGFQKEINDFIEKELNITH